MHEFHVKAKIVIFQDRVWKFGDLLWVWKSGNSAKYQFNICINYAWKVKKGCETGCECHL